MRRSRLASHGVALKLLRRLSWQADDVHGRLLLGQVPLDIADDPNPGNDFGTKTFTNNCDIGAASRATSDSSSTARQIEILRVALVAMSFTTCGLSRLPREEPR